MKNWVKDAESIKEQIISDRRYLHEHAEFGMNLPKTKAYVVKRLTEMGYRPEECGGGIVATIGKKGKVILIRADMDALQVKEENQLPFRSKTNVAHMCGHDLHTAILLGTAALLKKNEERLGGTVKLMFQPGEEIGAGAKSMIEHGVLENPKVDAALSLHAISHIENGKLSFKVGAAFSSADIFKIEIKGKGAHGSAPEYAIDPIYAGVQVYQAIEGIISRETSMFQSAVCTIGHFEAGKMGNVIPETATLEGSLRCYDEESRKRILSRIEEILKGVERATGTKITMESMGLPLLKNSEDLCRKLAPTISQIEGLDFYEESVPINASEDFGYVSEIIPTMYMLLGVGKTGMPVNHNAKAIFQDDKIYLASAVFASAAETYLK